MTTNTNTSVNSDVSNLRNNKVEVITSVQRRRRWTLEEKLEIVKRTIEPGSSVSLVARELGITAPQLFKWRKAYLEGSLVAVGANESVVPASELNEAMKRIKQLEGALGRKTLENEVLKEAGTLPKQKSGLRARHYCPGKTNKSRL